MSQWPPSTPGTFGQDSGSPDLMQIVQWLKDHLLQSRTPGGDVSDPANLAAERAHVVQDYARRGAAPNQMSDSPMTQNVLAQAASRAPTQYQQGNPGGSTEALIADLVDQTKRAGADPNDGASRQQIQQLLETLNTRGITPDQALSLAQQQPSPQAISEPPPVVPTQFPEQLGPPAPPPAQPPTAQGPAVDPAELQRERGQVTADYAAHATPFSGPTQPPSGPMNQPQMPPPPGSLSPLDLGVSPALAQALGPGNQLAMPPTPQPGPPVSRDPKQDLIRAIVLGLMMGAGPRSGIGTGAGQGFLSAQAGMQAEQDRRFKIKEAEALKQQTLIGEQQRSEAVRQEQRQKTLQSALTTIKARVDTLPNKAQYDQEIERYANMLQGAGYRLDSQWLRRAVPYISPSAEKLAKTAVDGFLKNPANQALITQHPDQLSKVMLTFDRDGDGIPEHVPLLMAAQLAGTPFGVDSAGELISYPKGTSADGKANADGIFEDLLAQAKAEGKDPNSPRVRTDLRTKAMAMAKDAARDPDVTALATSTAQLRNELLQMQVGQQPTQEDAVKMATQLLEHKMAPSQLSLLGGFGASGQAFKRMVLIEAQKQDPSFNLEEAESTYQLAKSPGFQQNIRYMTSVQESMPRLLTNARTLANGNIRAINGLINAGKNQFNDVDLKKFKTDVTLVADEVAKILQGGGTGSGTSDAKLKQASELLSATDSPNAIASALEEIDALIGFRKKALTRGTYLDQAPATPAGSADAYVRDPVTGKLRKQ